jgi:hypothetical protein
MLILQYDAVGLMDNWLSNYRVNGLPVLDKDYFQYSKE